MSTSASEDSSCTKNTESRKWILSNPVIDNPIYDLLEEPTPHSLSIFDTEDHTYTYLVDASILTKPLFSTLSNAEFSHLNAAIGANAELSKKDLDPATDKTEIKELDAKTQSYNLNAATHDKTQSYNLNAATPPPATATPLEEVIHYVATQHIIVVETGEDVAEKIISLAKDGPKSVNILSATGKIAKVITARRPTEIETHEGLYNIVSLSGSFMSDKVEGQLRVIGGLYISLATDYGISFKGRVAGELAAASPVEVTVRIVTSESEKES